MLDAVAAVTTSIRLLRRRKAVQCASHRQITDGVDKDLEPVSIGLACKQLKLLWGEVCVAKAPRPIRIWVEEQPGVALDHPVHKELDRSGADERTLCQRTH